MIRFSEIRKTAAPAWGEGGGDENENRTGYSYLIICKNFTIYLFFDSVCRDSKHFPPNFLGYDILFLIPYAGIRIFSSEFLVFSSRMIFLSSVLLCKGGSRCS